MIYFKKAKNHHAQNEHTDFLVMIVKYLRLKTKIFSSQLFLWIIYIW